MHCVFSTKERKPLIPDSIKHKLWAYIGGIARANKFKALAVGGMPDHVHVLFSLRATVTAAKALRLIKGGSSKWMNDQSRGHTFGWQDSYGVFSTGISQVEDTVRYIDMQEEHHKKLTVENEFKQFLKRHCIEKFRGQSAVPCGDLNSTGTSVPRTVSLARKVCVFPTTEVRHADTFAP